MSDSRDVRIGCAEWVAKNAALSEVDTVSLTSEPTRELWFKDLLPNLDYEIAGGTWDEPRWAWQEHPWFSALGLTDEECYAAFRPSSG